MNIKGSDIADLTRAIGNLLQEDLQELLDGTDLEVRNGGFTPSDIKSVSTIYLVSISDACFYQIHIRVWEPHTLSMSYDDNEHTKVYNEHLHIRCGVRFGLSWDIRTKNTLICPSVFGFVDAPNSSRLLAVKLIKTVDAHAGYPPFVRILPH